MAAAEVAKAATNASTQNEYLDEKTSDAVAGELGVSRATVQRGGDQVAALLDKAKHLHAIHAAPLKRETQQQTTDAVGCSRELVKKVAGTKSCQCQEKVPIPDWVTRDHERAAFRKLPADERERLGSVAGKVRPKPPRRRYRQHHTPPPKQAPHRTMPFPREAFR